MNRNPLSEVLKDGHQIEGQIRFLMCGKLINQLSSWSSLHVRMSFAETDSMSKDHQNIAQEEWLKSLDLYT